MELGPQRIVSLQPSVTSTLDRLDLLDRVVACTKYCVDVCPSLREHPKIIVADSWSAKSKEILAAEPDLIIACVPYQLEAVAEIMKAGVRFLGFAPHSLDDVLSDIAFLAQVMGVPNKGITLVRTMQDEIEKVRLRTAEVVHPRVYCEEWGKPLIHSQGWVADLIEAAGGSFLGAPGATADADGIRDADPEVILAAWCGAGDRVPLEKIIEQRGWQSTTAAREDRVYCINDEYLNTPGPSLIDGLHALAAAIHPAHFPAARGLRRINTRENV